MEKMDTKIKHVDVIPMVKHYMTELGLHELFDKYVPNDKGFEIKPAQVLCMMVMNIVVAPRPLYKIDEWLIEYMSLLIKSKFYFCTTIYSIFIE